VREAIWHRASISGSTVPPIWRRLPGPRRGTTAGLDSPAVPLVPILLYHSVSSAPPSMIAPFAVDRQTFGDHLDLVVERGLTSLTVTGFLDAADRGDRELLERCVVITFDDGFADFDDALPALSTRGLRATLYVATGLLRGAPAAVDAPALSAEMLAWSRLRELHAEGVELGAHSHSHPQLDTLSTSRARDELSLSRRLLEDAVGMEVKTFAYPNGYSSPRVRTLVREAGYRAACGVKNTLSSERDDRFALARLMIRSSTSTAEVAGWLDRSGAPPPRARERARTRAWRTYRRARAVVTRRAGTAPGWPASHV